MSGLDESNLTDTDERLMFNLRKILEEEDVIELYFNFYQGVYIWNTKSTPQGHSYERKNSSIAIKGMVPQKRG